MHGLKPVAIVAISFIFTSGFAGGDSKTILNRYAGKNYTTSSESISSSPNYDKATSKINKEEKTAGIESISKEKNIERTSESLKYVDKFDSFYGRKHYRLAMPETEDDDDQPKEEKKINMESLLRNTKKIGSDLKSPKYIGKVDRIYQPKNYGQAMSEAEDDDDEDPKEEKTINIKRRVRNTTETERALKSSKYIDKVDSFNSPKNYGQAMLKVEDDNNKPKEEKMINIERRVTNTTETESFDQPKNYGQSMLEIEDDDEEPKEDKMINIENRGSNSTETESVLQSSEYIDKVDSFHHRKNYGQAMSESEDDDEEPKEEKMINIENRGSNTTETESALKSLKYIDKVDSFNRPKNYGQVMSESEDDDGEPKEEKTINIENLPRNTKKIGSDLKSSKYIDKVDSFHRPKNDGQAMSETEDDDDEPKEEKMINIERRIRNTTETESALQSSENTDKVDSFHRPKNYGQAMSEAEDDDEDPKEEKMINTESPVNNTTETESALQSSENMDNVDSFNRPKNYGQAMSEAEDDDEDPREEKMINIESPVNNTTDTESDLQSSENMDNVDSFNRPKIDGRAVPEEKNYYDEPTEEKITEENMAEGKMADENMAEEKMTEEKKTESPLSQELEVDDDEKNILCPEKRSGFPDGEENESLPTEPDENKEDLKEDDKWEENPEDKEESGPEVKSEEDKWDEKVDENQEEKKEENNDTHKGKSSQFGLSSCLGFGDDLVIKILLGGATDCEKSEDARVPIKNVYSMKNNDYDYTSAFSSGTLVDHNETDFRLSEELHVPEEDNPKNYDYDYSAAIQATNESFSKTE